MLKRQQLQAWWSCTKIYLYFPLFTKSEKFNVQVRNNRNITKQLHKYNRHVCQVADGGTASRYGGHQRIYWISSRGQPTRGGPPAWWLGEVPRATHRKKLIVVRYMQTSLGISRLLWMRWWTFGFHKMRGIYGVAEGVLASQEAHCSMKLVMELAGMTRHLCNR